MRVATGSPPSPPEASFSFFFSRFGSEAKGGPKPVGGIDRFAFTIKIGIDDDVAAVWWVQRRHPEGVLEVFFAQSFVSHELNDRLVAVASRILRTLGSSAACIPLFFGGLFGRDTQCICAHGIFIDILSHARICLCLQRSGTAQRKSSSTSSQKGRGEVCSHQEEHQSHQHAHVGHGDRSVAVWELRASARLLACDRSKRFLVVWSRTTTKPVDNRRRSHGYERNGCGCDNGA
mmetsp:Transcript_4609/g.29215  ORF Transcript_4609/g.29215 Transcript_4609/m.29215 type:complete len:233 (-) Transcript_4609:31-729(-)